LVSGNGINSQTKDPLTQSMFLSARIGYQTVDDRFKIKDVPLWYGEDLPAAFNYDIGLDIPFGKNYFAGINYNGWYSSDDVYDDGDSVTFSRKIYGSNVDVLFKYRYRFSNFIFAPGIGFGSTLFKTKFSGYKVLEGQFRSNRMANITIQLNLEYLWTKHLMICAGITYYGMKQFSPGGNRSNNVFQFKTGLNYSVRL